MSARAVAVKVLGKTRRFGSRLDIVLEQECKTLTKQDRDLVLHLCCSTVQNYRLIDFELGKHISFNKTQPQIADILRLGICQIWFANRIPRYAVVAESVSLAKKFAPYASGLVNAVLRKIPDTPPETDDICIKYSMPDWLYGKLLEFMTSESQAEDFFAASNTVAPLCFHVSDNNILLPDTVKPHPELTGCYLLTQPDILHELIAQGKGIIADPAARLVVMAADPKPGMRVWDCCAAPGGKSFMSALAMDNKGVVYSTDIAKDKLSKIKDGAKTLGLSNIRVGQADARTANADDMYDIVLCDVPCSGFGVLRKKPDIRFKSYDEIDQLPDLQLQILSNISKAVRPGGTLVYSTCTILPEENSGVIERFLKNNPEFTKTAFCLPIAGDCPDGQITLWPHKHNTDGFFICKMQKTQ